MPFTRALSLIAATACILPHAYALPSFARQTGQRCAACHVGGNWPQLTPWGRWFKLAGYTAGKSMVDKEGFNYVPIGVLGNVGVTWAAQPNNSQGQPVVTQNGTPEAYEFTGELGTKLTDFAGLFYEYVSATPSRDGRELRAPLTFELHTSFIRVIMNSLPDSTVTMTQAFRTSGIPFQAGAIRSMVHRKRRAHLGAL